MQENELPVECKDTQESVGSPKPNKNVLSREIDVLWWICVIL